MSATVPVQPASDPTTLGGLAAWGARRLGRASSTPRLDAELLLAHAAGLRRGAILAFPERAVGAAVRRAFAALVERRAEEVPVAYLLGQREFYSVPLAVTPAVLVPRPETELAVELALQLIGDDAAEMLDLGTGSGAIALAVKQVRPRARVTGIERSRAALAVARGNAAALGLDVELIEADWFGGVGGRRFDLLVANPPYVASGDPALSGALRHEPRAALDGGPDGLDAIRAIIAAAPEHLRSGGHLLVEHGDCQGEASRALARDRGFDAVRTLRDLAGLDRLLAATWP